MRESERESERVRERDYTSVKPYGIQKSKTVLTVTAVSVSLSESATEARAACTAPSGQPCAVAAGRGHHPGVCLRQRAGTRGTLGHVPIQTDKSNTAVEGYCF